MISDTVVAVLAFVGCILIILHLLLFIINTVDWITNTKTRLEALECKTEFLDKRYYRLQEKIDDCITKTMPVVVQEKE